MKLSSCFFSDLVSLTIITCGKLIGYEKTKDLLHKYVSLFFQITIIIFKTYVKSRCHLRHKYL